MNVWEKIEGELVFMNLIQKILKDLKNKKEQKKSLKFIALIFAWSVLFTLVFLFVPLKWIELIPAFFSLILFKLLGFQAQLVLQEPVLIQFTNFEYVVSITLLCSGLIESIILISCILASSGINWSKRIIGGVIGLIVLNTANVLRIITSVLVLKFFGKYWGELFHEILFRIILFIGIAGIYLIWFLWATKNKKMIQLINKLKTILKSN